MLLEWKVNYFYEIYVRSRVPHPRLWCNLTLWWPPFRRTSIRQSPIGSVCVLLWRRPSVCPAVTRQCYTVRVLGGVTLSRSLRLFSLYWGDLFRDDLRLHGNAIGRARSSSSWRRGGFTLKENKKIRNVLVFYTGAKLMEFGFHHDQCIIYHSFTL